MSRKIAVWAAVVVMVCAARASFGASTWYLSTVPLGGTVPAPTIPDVTINVGETVTLYMWAQFSTATSTAMGWDFVETNKPIVVGSNVQVWNGVINPGEDPGDPEIPPRDWQVTRWNAWEAHVNADGDVGFAAVGGFNDPIGDNAIGITNSKRTLGDPTWRGTSPYQWYVASVDFTGAVAGETDLFLTINETLMVGNTGMIGTPVNPGLYIGPGDGPVSVFNAEGTYYLGEGTTGSIRDAHITVVPEPATVGLVAVAGLAMMRRR